VTTTSVERRISPIHLGAVLFAVFSWGIGPVLTLAMSVSINATIFYRVMMWPPLLLAVMLWRRVPINIATLKVAVVPGLFFGLSTITGFVAFVETSIANATVIGNVSAALSLLLAPRFLGERITLIQVVFAATSFAGIIAVVFGAGGTGGASLWGDFLALLNAFMWTGYFLVGKRARLDGINTWAFLFGVSIVQMTVVLPWVFATTNDIGAVTLRDLFVVLCMTLLPGTAGHGLMVWSQRFVPAGVISLLGLLGPVISMVLAWWFFGQGVAAVQLFGALVVLLSLAGVVRYGARTNVQPDMLGAPDPLLD
jgi:drug/metabolite transporter (DMT)-like permease